MLQHEIIKMENNNLNVNFNSDHLFKLARENNWDKIFEDEPAFSDKEFWDSDSSNKKTLLHYVFLSNPNNVESTVAKLLKIMEQRIKDQKSKIDYVNRQDANHNTALQLATKDGNKAVVKLLMNASAEIYKLKPDSDANALRKMYDSIILKSFDESLQITKDSRDLDNELLWKVNCNFEPVFGKHNALSIKDEKPFKQTWHLAIILRRKIVTQSLILKHPLVKLFLHFKMKKFVYLLYATMIYQILWSLIGFVFIFCNTQIREVKSIDGVILESNLTRFCQPFEILEENSGKLQNSGYIVIMVLFGVWSIVKELIEFKLYPEKRYYWTQFENIGQWIVIATMLTVWIVTLTSPSPEEMERKIILQTEDNFLWAIYLPAVYILGMFSALLLIQSELAKTTYLGVYNEMFLRGFKGIFKFVVAFLPVLFAFLTSLHILLPMRPEFQPQWGLGFPKMLVMMTGEVGYDDILYGENTENNAFNNLLKVFFFVFVIIVVILLQNLLIGLTVSDVQNLEQIATTKYLASTIEDIYLLENAMRSKWMWTIIRNLRGEDWYMKTFMIGRNDVTKPAIDLSKTEQELREDLQLKDYPGKLRDLIIEWHNETNNSVDIKDSDC